MDTKEITITETKAVSIDNTDYKTKCLEYLSSMGNKLPQKHQTQFLELASAFKLNPFKREIYAVGYGENWNIITGYNVYIKIGERTGKLNGWNVTVEGKGEEMTATVTIHRKDWEYPFEHTVLFSEVCQKTKDGKLNSVWSKMPSFMCKKVAIAQGFRLCFSDELAGMPYTSDELPEIEVPNVRDVTPEPAKIPSKPKTEKTPAKYTKEQAMEIKNIVECLDSAGLVVFDEEEKARYRQMLIDGEFEKAKEESTKIRDQRCKTIEVEPSEVYDGNAELDKIADGLF